jgi:hypothetical protein
MWVCVLELGAARPLGAGQVTQGQAAPDVPFVLKEAQTSAFKKML